MKSVIKKLAKKAFILSLTDGEIVPSKIKAVLKELTKAKFDDRLLLLKEYRHLLMNNKSENTVLVQTGFSIDQEMKLNLESVLKKRFKIQEIVFQIDHELIGGIRINHNNTIYDYSIAGRLNQLKETFA
ncbi:MAG: hypothetical protein A3F35_01990 [Candidatus Woykebacteria bacterium RIFCSPHIGHO2_12_FULL_45_10]|uniref:Uncharacterized protein n=1 Tax=Candidatus Woykebacteria bacterium RIFCSPHIGHO2_12_FULL_45_10 TaxID=1802603 RepID=A0A1G1WPE9_9BACT|nr:MAG: hypothetical protein A3F35_01990 [Candidatus Woykebacteria bacterium RIFCSPHIGHO2_12_FULL_45_10]